jgi:heme oxygenase
MISHTHSLAEHLRGATRVAHQGLDQHPLLRLLVGEDLDVASYATILASLHGPQAALESVLTPPLAALGLSETFPPRLAQLEADLTDLVRRPFPLHGGMPERIGDAELVGLLYVLEGSRLGGALIQRQLAHSLPADAPRRFFTVDGDPQRWSRFREFAADHAGELACRDRVTAAALAGFALYRRHLDACLGHLPG